MMKSTALASCSTAMTATTVFAFRWSRAGPAAASPAVAPSMVMVERLDDLERVEALGVQPGTLVFFRARRATETAARSLATRVAW